MASKATAQRGKETDTPVVGGAMPFDVVREQKAFNLVEALTTIAKQQNRPPFQLVTEYAKLAFGSAKITAEEFFAMRLYDDAAVEDGDRKAFVGLAGSRKIWGQANFRQDFMGIVANKITACNYLAAHGLPTIPILAFYTEAGRSGKGVLTNAGELSTFLLDPTNYPLFGKPVDAFQSLGSVSLTGYDPKTGRLCHRNGDETEVEAFLAEIAEAYASGYLFQRLVLPHRDIRAICGERLATVRVLTVMSGGKAEVVRASWKIPAGRNAADNFWRKGNLLAGIDLDSGTVKRVICGAGLDFEEISSHPDTGAAMIGMQLPYFAEVKQLAISGAAVFKELGLIGWDIAITDGGPIVVEPNETPDLMLPQMSDRRGILDARFRSFLDERAALERDYAKGLKRKVQAETMNTIKRVAGAV